MMNRIFPIVAGLFILIGLLSSTIFIVDQRQYAAVFAFGELGHQMVCSMAYQLLSPVSQQKVQQLMQLHEQKDFTKACSWPDQVRSLPEYQHTKVWHYVNIQRSDTKLTMQHCPAEGCVLSAIEQQRKKLTPFAPSKTQLEALLFVAYCPVPPIHAGAPGAVRCGR